MDSIREAFKKVKNDIDSLRKEVIELKQQLIKTNEKKSEILKKIESLSVEKDPTIRHINSTIPTHNPTHNTSFKPLKTQNMGISTGNRGVPTDKQTNRQTDRHIENSPKIKQNTIENATKILESLDSIKKELRLKFKNLTDQEFLVFSTLYQIEEETNFVDYKILSKKLNLSESSIRDYIGRLIKKEIPVDKKRINNKNIQLSISQNLKKIATLNTILQLREL